MTPSTDPGSPSDPQRPDLQQPNREPSAPSPAAMPSRQFEAAVGSSSQDPSSQDTGDELSELDTQAAVASVQSVVTELLEQVDEIRQSSDGTFDPAALERQTALLEQAHDVLTTALDSVDRR